MSCVTLKLCAALFLLLLDLIALSPIAKLCLLTETVDARCKHALNALHEVAALINLKGLRDGQLAGCHANYGRFLDHLSSYSKPSTLSARVQQHMAHRFRIPH